MGVDLERGFHAMVFVDAQAEPQLGSVGTAGGGAEKFLDDFLRFLVPSSPEAAGDKVDPVRLGPPDHLQKFFSRDKGISPARNHDGGRVRVFGKLEKTLDR